MLQILKACFECGTFSTIMANKIGKCSFFITLTILCLHVTPPHFLDMYIYIHIVILQFSYVNFLPHLMRSYSLRDRCLLRIVYTEPDIHFTISLSPKSYITCLHRLYRTLERCPRQTTRIVGRMR